MDKIVFVGSFTPMQKVLYAIKKITNLKYLALYTRLDDVVIKKLAVEQNIKVNNIDILRTQEGKDELRSLEPDWIFNVNSTFIFPKDILSIPRFGSLNLHPGKLPEYAGLHTHQWAIRNDERSFASTMN
ncbi:MAG TPA: formyltransferase family protein, partial [Candidatus Omnitrophota bacterium]|nr:formyltransferase family protein [Candidatus Omnitrophota bacterium]